MRHPALPLAVSKPISFKTRHPWLSCIWDGGRIWATRMGCVWLYPEEETDLD